MLHLPTIRAQFPDLAEAAAREQMSYRGFLAEMLMAECDDRARRRSERQIKAAGFPRDKSPRTFDFVANPAIDPAVIHTLATCDWVKKGLPLCLIGDSGTGKSHLLIALGTEAAMAGHRYTLATKLVNSSSKPPTTGSSPRQSPATAASTCSASTSSATWNSTAAAPSCCSRS
jgi:DNA replication protein DnaC